MKQPLVSIITVCYNSEKTIEKTIKSVLNQTYKNIEYIIIDGKSTDSTIEIAKKYEKEFNGRMKIYSEKDTGIYNAMNKGIDKASGTLIGIINSDDYYEKNAVELMVNNMTDDKYQILYGYMKIVKKDVLSHIIIYNHENLKENMINHPTCFITKDIYDDFGKYNEKYRSCADYEFMLRQLNNNVKFIPILEIIATFNYGGMSQKIDSHIECLKMINEFGLISKKEYTKKLLKLYIKKILK